MVDAAGKPLPLTSHTLAPVPVAIGGPGKQLLSPLPHSATPPFRTRRSNSRSLPASGLPAGVSLGGSEKAGLANITATMMNLMGLEAPADYEQSLIAVV